MFGEQISCVRLGGNFHLAGVLAWGPWRADTRNQTLNSKHAAHVKHALETKGSVLASSRSRVNSIALMRASVSLAYSIVFLPPLAAHQPLEESAASGEDEGLDAKKLTLSSSMSDSYDLELKNNNTVLQSFEGAGASLRR